MYKYKILSTLALLISAISFSQEVKNYDDLYAINDTVKNKKGEILQEVIITSNQQKNPVNVGKAGIKPMDLPQATAVINQATIQNQQINSVTDLLKNVNGVYIIGTTGGYQEEIASRGSALSSSNTFKNGVRYFSGMKTEFSGIEKAEFLKGSTAILYGNVAPGGILNLVTKKPKFDFGGEIGLTYGSFDAIKPTLDLYGSLNKSKTMAFRINGSYSKANSFRKEVNSESYYFNPSFLVKFTKKTQLLIEGDLLKSTATPDFGAGIINYKIVDIPRDRFLGVSWGYFDAKQSSATATLTHKINDTWDLSFINGLRFYETDLFTNSRPNASGGTIQANGNWTRSIQRSEVKDNYFIQQLDLKGKFNTGKIEHQFLFGADSEIYKTKTTAYIVKSNYDTINIFQDYNSANEPVIPTLLTNTLTTAPVNRFGIYTQDLINFNKYIKLLAGVRYSYQDTKSDVLTYSTNTTVTTNNYDQAFSPRIGLIVQPSNNHSLFASYSNSFQVNTGTDISGAALKPSIIDQYEIGIKNKLFEDRLFANLTVYQISNSNLAQTSLENGNTNTNIKELAGKTRSQGVELDIVANPLKGLSIIAGYSFSETKYIESNTYIEGSELKYNPKNTANLSFNYKVETGKLKGLNFGLINTYFGKRYAGRSTRITVANDAYQLIPLNDFIQVDATLSYVCKKWAVRTKLSNVFNELNYNIHDDNSLNPIAPRNYSISLNYTF
ncbi:TonB-dependent siderophore receptor [Flavobacterium sp. SUN052]|uniref:TonB-dependent siderophore receptor n=1 Tax=Flavobacterium sp. SUN052 TaxID=3002441 RepID=UPI00237D4FEB|nr:TonB-dependent siderophore receptor [Flavobacterium sp. SUN052]MEC4005712.1 TonB-dependent siderophore receptor [Flavobacterium sp. SUN052]